MITTRTTTSRREGLIDIVDYYWGLSDERKLSTKQCDQLKDAMNELRGSGDTADQWANVAKEILDKQGIH